MESKNSFTGTNVTLGTNPHCFHQHSLKLTWSESREKCQSNGGDLVQIKSRDEQDFLEGRVSSPSCCDKFWIGLTDSQTEGEWLWCDGSPLNQSLAFWTRDSHNTEPDNWKEEDEEGENCAAIWEHYPINNPLSWYDVSCKKRHRFICDKPADSTTTCG
uniref:C-type lectin domain-containing protein n=1 Tax=Knipowitschia caucasica TaxID=637954 RepID=A0AAV2K7U6_KNICA